MTQRTKNRQGDKKNYIQLLFAGKFINALDNSRLWRVWTRCMYQKMGPRTVQPSLKRWQMFRHQSVSGTEAWADGSGWQERRRSVQRCPGRCDPIGRVGTGQHYESPCQSEIYVFYISGKGKEIKKVNTRHTHLAKVTNNFSDGIMVIIKVCHVHCQH